MLIIYSIYGIWAKLGSIPNPERTPTLEFQGELCMFEYLI